VLIVGVFQSRVFLDRSRIGKVNVVTLTYQQVNQPVPIIGGLDDNADDLFLVWLQSVKDKLTIVRQVRLDSFLEAYQSADALWYAEVPSYDYQTSELIFPLLPLLRSPGYHSVVFERLHSTMTWISNSGMILGKYSLGICVSISFEEAQKRLHAGADVIMLSLDLKRVALRKCYPELSDDEVSARAREEIATDVLEIHAGGLDKSHITS
jgi:hypothetical protein